MNPEQAMTIGRQALEVTFTIAAPYYWRRW